MPKLRRRSWRDDNFENGRWGCVRSVAIDPRFQRSHLMRPVLSAVCYRLRELGHQRAFLATSIKRLPAIKLYWRFGFRPHLQNENDARVWCELEERLEPTREKE